MSTKLLYLIRKRGADKTSVRVTMDCSSESMRLKVTESFETETGKISDVLKQLSAYSR
ncbi:MAG: hypothetical protein MUE33_11640 [Cytophagaceae bacterium]|jgi:hypothetical protein|nr:hypothetical protein [Cytophagaceae bacterium]